MMERPSGGFRPCAPVPPIPPAVGDRPLWSVAIPVHDCASLLARALQPVMAQVGGRAEVIVVDDASSDDPRSIAERVGGGAVRYERTECTLGIARNFNRCLTLAGGQLVHVLHGDDEVMPGFYAAMEAPFRDPACMAVVCRTQYIDVRGRALVTTRSERTGDGWWEGALATLAVSNRVRPSSIVVRRAVYEQIGGFREDLDHATDWEMWARVAAHGRIWFIDRVLARHRVHAASDTAHRVKMGDNIRERVVAIHEVNLHVDPAARPWTTRRALGYAAVFAFRTAARQARTFDVGAMWAQTREGARCAGLALVPLRGEDRTGGRAAECAPAEG